MKRSSPVILLATITLLGSGCVSRTTTLEPQHRGDTLGDKKSYGSDPQSKVLEKKIVWIWQDEFRNAK